ncbi:MAG: MBL fold metallo-hydrolase [Candidatus Hydrogenedentes bacterium]|nr:MBL fold metallo-hydrolase [Candidatus Hydrogenedentota bacterium]
MLRSCASMLVVVFAASSDPINPALGPGDDAFMSRQSEAFLSEIAKTLDTVPPAVPEPRERTLALRLLDAVLHDTHSPNQPSVQAFYHARMERAIQQMEKSRTTEGMQIWKAYNHGFVVRTSSITVGFDLFRGPARFRWDGPEGRKGVDAPGFPIPDAWADRLAAQCDVLFISHEHRDHADPYVAEAFLKLGKPVVAPVSVFADTPLQGRITHMKREAHTVQELPIQNGKVQLQVVVYPGFQYQDGGPENNVTLVISPEGYSFAHNGDQINDPYPQYQEDFKWIDAVKDHHRVDLLMTNNWTNDVLRMARGFNPQLVIPGHENELGHQANDRVPYWGDETFLKLNFTEMKAQFPAVVMTWGETYRFVPNR